MMIKLLCLLLWVGHFLLNMLVFYHWFFWFDNIDEKMDVWFFKFLLIELICGFNSLAFYYLFFN